MMAPIPLAPFARKGEPDSSLRSPVTGCAHPAAVRFAGRAGVPPCLGAARRQGCLGSQQVAPIPLAPFARKGEPDSSLRSPVTGCAHPAAVRFAGRAGVPPCLGAARRQGCAGRLAS